MIRCLHAGDLEESDEDKRPETELAGPHGTVQQLVEAPLEPRMETDDAITDGLDQCPVPAIFEPRQDGAERFPEGSAARDVGDDTGSCRPWIGGVNHSEPDPRILRIRGATAGAKRGVFL